MITADTYYPAVSGLARFVRQLSEGLSRRGHEVHLVVPSWVGEPVTTMTEGVTVHGVRSYRLLPGRPVLRLSGRGAARSAVAALLNQLSPELVHINGQHLIGRAALAAAEAAGVPVLATNHFMPENVVDEFPMPRFMRRRFVRWLWSDTGRALLRCTAVTAPTATAAQMLAARAGIPDATAISCGIDMSRFPAPNSVRRSGRSVLYVGRLDREKRLGDLLRAIAMAPGLELDLIGAGRDDKTLKRLVGRLGIADRVRFRGRVSEVELLRAYAEAGVFCMPGVAELQSLATLEALAAGLPVIAADAAALPHLVRAGITGWLYPPGDVSELARRLAETAGDEPRRAAMGRAARDLASRHALAATLDGYEHIYQMIAGTAVTSVALRQQFGITRSS